MNRSGKIAYWSALCVGFCLLAAGRPLLADEPRDQEEAIKNLQERVRRLEQKAQAQREHSLGNLRVYWKEGLRLETADKRFKFKLGGRIMNDWAFISEDDGIKAAVGNQEDGTEFRRARLYLAGTIYRNLQFKAQYDFAGGEAKFKDVWIGMKDVPFVGHIKVGHHKESFGLEELTSSKYITFIERSLPMAFAPSRNTGASIYNTLFEERATWAVGAFRETDAFGKRRADGGGSVTARVTGLPWYEDGGAKLLHLGLGASARWPVHGMFRYRARPEVHLADRFVDTGKFEADRGILLGLETAFVCGPFSVQGEYVRADVNSDAAKDPSFSGFYAQASWFLTGEHRKYKKSAGKFGRIKPKKNFRHDGGWGAWELAVRYSEIDLEDSPIRGGKLSDVTVGTNWYLNPNVRVMLNGIFADLDDVGDAAAMTMPFQIDF